MLLVESNLQNKRNEDQGEFLDLRHACNMPLKNLGYDISEYSFANLYLFRQTHAYRIVWENNVPIVIGKTRKKSYFHFPIESFSCLSHEVIANRIHQYGTLYPVPEPLLPLFPQDRYKIFHDVDESDYVYTVEKMRSYRGRELQGKRNLVKQFLSNYSPVPKTIDQSNIEDAKLVLRKWQEDVRSMPDETDYDSCKEALEKFEQLGLWGYLYYLDQEPGGFLLLEELHPKMVAVHFAKGLRKFKGLYQYMYSHAAQNMPSHIQYMNFEQDMGNLALRIAKSSYEPDQMIHKYGIQCIDK